ncbi:MAG: DinB family protein [Schleiferiaceae bacterium]|nr:DinB family protein [Schleiferiaceae bacterium]
MESVFKSQITPDEYAPFYEAYIQLSPETHLKAALELSGKQLAAILDELKTEDLQKAYAPEKWTIADLLVHIFDAEMVFLSRALHIARAPGVALPGYDQDVFVASADANTLTIHQIRELFQYLRKTTLIYLSCLPLSSFTHTGSADGKGVSVRALGFMIVGHQLHHTHILLDRYLNR